MASNVHWEETLSVCEDFLERLEAFIGFPDQRSDDVFARFQFAITPSLSVQWVVKHDLFEGIVAQLSLIDQELGRFLAGDDRRVPQASAVLGTYALNTPEGRYQLTVAVDRTKKITGGAEGRT